MVARTESTRTERVRYLGPDPRGRMLSVGATTAPVQQHFASPGSFSLTGSSMVEPRATVEPWLETFVRSLAHIEGFRWVIVSDPNANGVIHLTTCLRSPTRETVEAVYDAQLAFLRTANKPVDFHVWTDPDAVEAIPSVPYAEIVAVWNIPQDAHAG